MAAAPTENASTKAQLTKASVFERISAAFLLSYFAVYVASNASSTYEPSESPAKHLVVVAAAVVSLLFRPRQCIRLVLIFLPIALLYLAGRLPAYALMAIVFAASLPVFGSGLAYLTQRDRGIVLLALAVVSLVPAAVSIGMDAESLFSSYYGRPRLLLGYWHPKEAAAILLVPILVYLMRARRRPGIAVLIALPALLWVVGSRNAALSLLMAIGLRHFPRVSYAALAAAFAGLLAFVVFSSSWYELIDDLSSLRFSVWNEAISDPIHVQQTDLLGGERLAIDSYYIELFLTTGAAGLAFFVLWALGFYWLHVRRAPRSTWIQGLFFAILFFSAFDSGIVSTGNIFHIVGWAVICIPLIKASSRRRARWRPRIGVAAPAAT